VKTQEQQCLEYVRNTNGGANIGHFVEDWEPIGRRAWDDFSNRGLVSTDEYGRIKLTDAGKAALAALPA
jgi:hypothetical protein